jgi:TonB family protein
LLAASLVSPFAFAGDDAAKALSFTARVRVAADGHATVSDLVGPKGALAELVASRLDAIRFVPGKRNGTPVAAEAELRGRVILTPVGTDDYDVSLRDVTTRPTWVEGRPPDFPPDRLRANQGQGAVEVRVRVDTRGHVSDAVIVSSTHALFEQAVLRVAIQWRFAPRIAETTAVVPVIFTEYRSRAAVDFKPQFQCVPDETRPNVEGDTGCVEHIEVYGMRVLRAISI